MTLLKEFIVVFGLAAPDLEIDSNMAYVVVAATVDGEEEKQPTWVGFDRRRATLHVPADQYIAAIPPGKYVISHIDFYGKNSSRGTQFLSERNILDLQAGKIYLIAHFQLTHVSGRKYQLNMGNVANLLIEACKRAPEIFKAFPVNTFGKKPEFKIACEQ